MPRTQDELKQLFRTQGAATDADMDEYINAGYDYDTVGGEKTKAWYDERKKALSPKDSTVDLNNVLPKDPIPMGALGQNTGYTGDPNTVRKELRSKYASDNAAYKDALKESGIEASSDPKSAYKMKSIQQAYYDGDIDKSTRDYMIIDTIAKFARNAGKDIGNVAAAYSGGTVNNEREQGAWDARNAEMMKQGISSEAATVENSDKNIERAQQKASLTGAQLANELADKKLILPREYAGLIKNADNIENPLLRAAVKGGARQLLDKSVSGGEIKPADLITSIIVAGGNDLSAAAKASGKTTEQFVMDELKSFLTPASNGLGSLINLGGDSSKASANPTFGAYSKSEQGNNYKIYGAGQRINEALSLESNKEKDKKSGNEFKKWVDKKGTRALIGRETSFDKMTDEELERALQVYIEDLDRQRTH